MPPEKIAFAHGKPGQRAEKWYKPKDHLERTIELALKFASARWA